MVQDIPTQEGPVVNHTNGNCLYAHSGGVSAALNATAAGAIKAAQRSESIHDMLVPEYGLHGILNGEFYSTKDLDQAALDQMYCTPSSIFGTSRFKLPDPRVDQEPYIQILEVFKTYNIRSLLYHGGGDSQDTTNKFSQFFKMVDYPIQCIGLPKTIDNDLMVTDHCPGYGSTAKYIATSTLEAALDTKAMSRSSTKVFILEVMGRNAGWIAAASALARCDATSAPHLILVPERKKSADNILAGISLQLDKEGYCVIVVSEGFQLTDTISSDDSDTCSFGHKRLGGIGLELANLIQSSLKVKTRSANADYLQRAVGHCASAIDLDIAYHIGQRAVQCINDGLYDKMLIVKHLGYLPLKWKIETCPIDWVANHEKHLPDFFISDNGHDITPAFCEYALSLVQGEVKPMRKNSIPAYFSKHHLQKVQIEEHQL